MINNIDIKEVVADFEAGIFDGKIFALSANGKWNLKSKGWFPKKRTTKIMFCPNQNSKYSFQSVKLRASNIIDGLYNA